MRKIRRRTRYALLKITSLAFEGRFAQAAEGAPPRVRLLWGEPVVRVPAFSGCWPLRAFTIGHICAGAGGLRWDSASASSSLQGFGCGPPVEVFVRVWGRVAPGFMWAAVARVSRPEWVRSPTRRPPVGGGQAGGQAAVVPEQLGEAVGRLRVLPLLNARRATGCPQLGHPTRGGEP
jgi:hypothetical protein